MTITPLISKPKPRIALALGGGAFHGTAHAGVLRVLEEENIPIDLIVGTSAGSLVGALYCDNPSAQALLPLVMSTKTSSVFDFSLIRSKYGFLSGKKLQKYITDHCHAQRIEDLHIPFVAVATDILEGKIVPLDSGSIADAVNASCAIPAIFEPVRMNGMTLVDGGVLDNVPTDICRQYQAEIVIAVDIMANIGSNQSIDNALKILYKSLLLAIDQAKAEKLRLADIVIAPDLTGMPILSGKMNRRIYDSGYQAAKQMVPVIKQTMKKKNIRY